MSIRLGLPHTDKIREMGYGLTKFIVERRRRETINEGIKEQAKIVPGCEKNKGSILQRGVEYITQLKNNETVGLDGNEPIDLTAHLVILFAEC